MFDYDPQVSLAVQERARQQRGEVSIYDISYAGSPGQSVTAYLLVPPGEGPFAGLLFMHPSGTGRYAFLEEALLVVQGGAVALLLDAPHAQQPHRPFFSFTETDRDDLIQSVINLRRGVDLLHARPDVDANRTGFVGFSYGASVGAMLASIEKRIKAYLLWGGGAHLSKFLHQYSKASDAYLEKMAALDSIHYVNQAAPAALLFQNGRSDPNVPEHEAEALFQAASEPKQHLWYDTGHALNGAACRDRFVWLRSQLDLAPLSPVLMKELGKFKLKWMARPK